MKEKLMSLFFIKNILFTHLYRLRVLVHHFNGVFFVKFPKTIMTYNISVITFSLKIYYLHAKDTFYYVTVKQIMKFTYLSFTGRRRVLILHFDCFSGKFSPTIINYEQHVKN